MLIKFFKLILIFIFFYTPLYSKNRTFNDINLNHLSDYFSDFTHEGVSLETLDKIKNIDYNKLSKIPRTTRLGSCLADTPNFYCIGLNYVKHAKETNAEIPKEPIVFSFVSSSINNELSTSIFLNII